VSRNWPGLPESVLGTPKFLLKKVVMVARPLLFPNRRKEGTRTCVESGESVGQHSRGYRSGTYSVWQSIIKKGKSLPLMEWPSLFFAMKFLRLLSYTG